MINTSSASDCVNIDNSIVGMFNDGTFSKTLLLKVIGICTEHHLLLDIAFCGYQYSVCVTDNVDLICFYSEKGDDLNELLRDFLERY